MRRIRPIKTTAADERARAESEHAPTREAQRMTGTVFGRMKTFEALLSIARISTALGYSYGTDRDLYQALGYVGQNDLTFDKYYAMYKRHAVAKAVIDRPVRATWSGELTLIESEMAEDTEFEKAWMELEKRLSLRTRFERLDKLTGLGTYGVLLLGLDDVKSAEGFVAPVNTGTRRLAYVKPLSEDSAKILSSDTSPSSERYGLPETYKIKVRDANGKETEIIVHHSRIIHVVDGLLESEAIGTPRLEAVFNNLKDLEKIVGGSAEMFWRGARPGYAGKIDPDYHMSTDAEDELQEQINEYEHNLRRMLILSGIELNALAPQVSDPGPHTDVQMQMISATTGIPKRILTGTERGELASSDDKSNWLESIESRRVEFAEPGIVRPFVDRCLKYKILPMPSTRKYGCGWSDLWAMSDKEQADVGRIRAEALRAWGASGVAMDAIPPEAFFEYFLGLDADEIEVIKKLREIYGREEMEDQYTEEELALIGPGNGETE